MSRLTLDVTVISADLIRRNSLFTTKRRTYAVITFLNGASIYQVTTNVSKAVFSPSWNSPMSFKIDESKLRRNSLMIVIQIRRKGPLKDKDIGLLYVPVKEIFDHAGGTHHRHDVALPVSSKSRKGKGVIYLSYAFSGRVAHVISQLPTAPQLPFDLDGLENSYRYTPYLDRGILVNSHPSAPNLGMYTPSAPPAWN